MAAIGLVMLGAGPARALVVTMDCANQNQSCTLDELFRRGTITINDKIFDSWALEFASPEVDLAQIVVTPIESALNPGLTFTANGQLTVSGQSEIDLAFNFTVATQGGVPRMTGSRFRNPRP